MKLYLMGFTTALCLISFPAFAYIDPGMGSMWIQSIIGIIAGFIVVLKVYWQRFKFFMVGVKKKFVARMSSKND